MDESSVFERMHGYDILVNKKRRNQNDGVIVYVRENLNVSSEEVSLHGATSIKIDIVTGSGRHSILAVYRSPSPDLDLELFIDNLESYCDSRPRDRTHWLIGDVNCCILPDTHNPTSQRYLDVLYGAGYVCDFKKVAHLISVTNWESVVETDDVNTSSELFVHQIQTILKNSTEDKHIPAKEMKIKPWMTRGLVVDQTQR
ncbi:hypothetical protein J6590_083554 [Homalodisca vitripennis]|nr:hypothetical protein J6590_083554 [Homalodisca vitripennis]